MSTGEVLLQMERFCAFRERSPLEARKKLLLFGLSETENARILAHLEAEGYVSEQRFAEAFAGGKFRVNRWGRVRIRLHLKQHQINAAWIDRALAEIKESEYRAVLQGLAERKWAELPADHVNRGLKVVAYLLQKGYEPPLVYEVLEHMK